LARASILNIDIFCNCIETMICSGASLCHIKELFMSAIVLYIIYLRYVSSSSIQNICVFHPKCHDSVLTRCHRSTGLQTKRTWEI